MGLGNLTVCILQHIGSCAVNDSHASPGWVAKPGGMFARFDAAPPRLDTDQFHLLVVDESAEDADRVRPAADTGYDHIRKTTNFHEHLFARLPPYDRLKFAHDRRIGMGSQRR